MNRSSRTSNRLGAQLQLLLVDACVHARTRARRTERGDVPGWVLITVMTAGLVAALWAVAGPQLSSMLHDALNSVRG